MPTGSTFKNSGWTRVEDCLPKNCATVLVYTLGWDVDNPITLGWYDGAYWLADMNGDFLTVTHWRPLPEPPKESK